ncbi:hypothetical protein AOLI_G00117770 [Acnodon oligacanthus]
MDMRLLLARGDIGDAKSLASGGAFGFSGWLSRHEPVGGGGRKTTIRAPHCLPTPADNTQQRETTHSPALSYLCSALQAAGGHSKAVCHRDTISWITTPDSIPGRSDRRSDMSNEMISGNRERGVSSEGAGGARGDAQGRPRLINTEN